MNGYLNNDEQHAMSLLYPPFILEVVTAIKALEQIKAVHLHPSYVLI